MGIKIEVVGLRPGEKLYEELFYEFENEVGTSHEKIRLATHPELNIQLFNLKIKELEKAFNSFKTEMTKNLMLEIINIDQPSQAHTNNVLPITK